MNITPMPDEVADGLRGEGLGMGIVAGIALFGIAYVHYKILTDPYGFTRGEKIFFEELTGIKLPARIRNQGSW